MAGETSEMRIVKWVVRTALAVCALLFFAFFVLAVPGCLSIVSGDWLFTDPADPGCGGEPDGPAAVVVFELDGGAERWAKTVGYSSELIAHGNVIVAGGYDGVIRGFASADGALAWCMEAKDLGGGGSGDLAVMGETLGVMADARTLVGLDPSTGVERWRTSIARPELDPSPTPTIAPDRLVELAAADGLFFVSDRALERSSVVAINAADGAIVEGATSPPPASSPFSGDTAEDAAGIRVRSTGEYRENRQERLITVVDTATGDELWSSTVPGYLSTIAQDANGSPAVVVVDQTGGTGDIGFGMGPDTVLTAYDGQTGAQLWQQPITLLTRDVHPAAPGMVVVTAGSELLAVDVTTGDELWSVDHGSPGKARPHSVTGNYGRLVPTGDGAIAGIIVAEKPYRD